MADVGLTELLLDAYELAERIKQSDEVDQYLLSQQHMQADPEASELIRGFHRLKEQFEEVTRFGIFHPNYHEAKERAIAYQTQLNGHPQIAQFLQAEEALNRLLFDVSKTLAHVVSDEVKVPNDLAEPSQKRRRCGK